MPQLSAVKYFASFIRKYTMQEIVLVVLMLLTSLGTLASPYILKLIIDDVFPAGNYSLLLLILLIYLVISIVRIVIQYYFTRLYESVSNFIMRDIRIALFAHLLRLPVKFFDDSKTGDIIHRINSEVNSIQSILAGSVVRILSSICTLLGLTVMLCLLNPTLFLIALSVLPVVFINTRYFQPRIHAEIRRSRVKDADILGYLMERFTNIRMVKSFMKYDFEERNLSRQIDRQIEINLRVVKLSSQTRNLSLLMTSLVPVLILCLGGRDVISGTMSVGSLVAFIQYSNRLYDPLRDLMGLYFDLVRASVSMSRIFDIVSLQTEESLEEQLPVQRGSSPGDIVFDNVSFQYEASPVLQDFNLSLAFGKSYAIVGHSGCGKSTIINLICRFYTPQRGKITLGGEEISQLDLASYRERVNLITQNNHIFHDSILNNINYGQDIHDEEQIAAALAASDLSAFVKTLPAGLHTTLGDNGTTLSGGQRQRLAIARSLLKQGDILILDEATSAVDSESEKKIMTELLRINRANIILIVSHRLSAIKCVDKILCMDKGQIVEAGSHDELVAMKGFYYRLFREQL